MTSDDRIYQLLERIALAVEGLRADVLARKPTPAPKAEPHAAMVWTGLVKAFVLMWQAHRGGLPACTTAGSADGVRYKSIVACIKECDDLDRWAFAIKALAASPHHRGQNERGWVANIDFLVQPSQRLKWLEAGDRLPREAPKVAPKGAWCQCGAPAIMGPGTRSPDLCDQPRCGECTSVINRPKGV